MADLFVLSPFGRVMTFTGWLWRAGTWQRLTHGFAERLRMAAAVVIVAATTLNVAPATINWQCLSPRIQETINRTRAPPVNPRVSGRGYGKACMANRWSSTSPRVS